MTTKKLSPTTKKLSPSTKKLSPSTQKYLEEVWGYKTVGEIDKLTLECIQENVDDEGFPADVEIIEARKNQ